MTLNTREDIILEIFIQPQKARNAYYLCSETAIYISSREEVKGNNLEGKRKQMTTEMHI